jgi:hypothetical protein
MPVETAGKPLLKQIPRVNHERFPEVWEGENGRPLIFVVLYSPTDGGVTNSERRTTHAYVKQACGQKFWCKYGTGWPIFVVVGHYLADDKKLFDHGVLINSHDSQ